MPNPGRNRRGMTQPLKTWVLAVAIVPAAFGPGCSSRNDGLEYREVLLDEASTRDTQGPESNTFRMQQIMRPFGPLPQWMGAPDHPLSEPKIALGKTLFEDKRLSASGEISCATCHPLDAYGVDGLPVAVGHKGRRGKRNTPTVFNAAGHIGQHWDGVFRTVEEQAKLPFFKSSAMAMPNVEAVMKVISSDPAYPSAFQEAFPEDKNSAISFDNLVRAIGAFERTLVTPSRWDRFLLGDESALSDKEKAGLSTFVEIGCAVCHKGPYVGGDRYRKLGSFVPWPSTEDLGRFLVTREESDRMVFKVASLRNVERTAPYFHDGSVTRLDEAVQAMAKHQLGLTLEAKQVDDIVAWLGVLTGSLPGN